MAEKIIEDLKQAGSEDMGSLLGMMNKFKAQEENAKEEVSKLEKLILLKDSEITDLDIELQSLNDFLYSVRIKQNDKISMYKSEIEQNKVQIKRSDKLIVDLQQRTEVSQSQMNETQEQISRKVRARDRLQLKLKELSDQRDHFCMTISHLEDKVNTYRSYVLSQNTGAQPNRQLGNTENLPPKE
mmetsp:Transcript_31717/g.48594  ORF Transcript_31717/g.48594 Transcript_31717/m.48594 type:complete len:185 (+) Transcript_31717:3-557(+)